MTYKTWGIKILTGRIYVFIIMLFRQIWSNPGGWILLQATVCAVELVHMNKYHKIQPKWMEDRKYSRCLKSVPVNNHEAHCIAHLLKTFLTHFYDDLCVQ